MTINLDLLDEKSVTEAINKVAEISETNDVNWALVGGFGYIRKSEKKKGGGKKKSG